MLRSRTLATRCGLSRLASPFVGRAALSIVLLPLSGGGGEWRSGEAWARAPAPSRAVTAGRVHDRLGYACTMEEGVAVTITWGKPAADSAALGVQLLIAILTVAASIIAAVVVARRQAATEVMKLRHAIAERRVAEFDGAASDIRAMVLDMTMDNALASYNARCRFRARDPGAAVSVLLAADLAMMPEHTRLLVKLRSDFAGFCRELAQSMPEAQDKPFAVPSREQLRCVGKVGAAIHFLMEAVDVSTEARLEGRSSKLHTARIRSIAERYAEQRAAL